MSITENVGFIGSGGIACAMARGLCNARDFSGSVGLSVHVNRRMADELKAMYPQRIVIYESNQELLDNSVLVVPSLLPGVLKSVAGGLRFREDHRIIHIAAGIKVVEAARLYAPAKAIIRSVPLPFASENSGPVVFYGDDEMCERLLSCLGSVVKVKTERDLEILAAVTGEMVAYYGLVAEMVRWCCKKGLDFKSALDYTCFMNEALSSFMMRNCTSDMEAFMLENTTPGGMNELALRILRERDAYTPWSCGLEAIGKHYDL